MEKNAWRLLINHGIVFFDSRLLQYLMQDMNKDKAFNQGNEVQRRTVMSYQQLFKLTLMRNERKTFRARHEDKQNMPVGILERKSSRILTEKVFQQQRRPPNNSNALETVSDIQTSLNIIPPLPKITGPSSKLHLPFKQISALDAIKVTRRSVDESSRKKEELFHKIKWMNREFDKKKAFLVRNRSKKDHTLNGSKLSLPANISCRSIAPLSEQNRTSQQEPIFMDINKNSKQKTHKHKKSSRYNDIPLSEFIYDKNSKMIKGQDQGIEKKLQRICRSLESGQKGQIQAKNKRVEQ